VTQKSRIPCHPLVSLHSTRHTPLTPESNLVSNKQGLHGRTRQQGALFPKNRFMSQGGGGPFDSTVITEPPLAKSRCSTTHQEPQGKRKGGDIGNGPILNANLLFKSELTHVARFYMILSSSMAWMGLLSVKTNCDPHLPQTVGIYRSINACS
jgi:hypothetical protein